MEDLASKIKERIKGNLALVGIGNPLRGDDGFGPKLIESLKGSVDASLFDCGTAPENYIIPILNSNPRTVILLDAADFGSPPGEVDVFEIDSVSNRGFSTHNMSPRMLADLMKTGASGLNIFLVAVQPKNIAFGEKMSEEVMRGMERLKDVFVEVCGR